MYHRKKPHHWLAVQQVGLPPLGVTRRSAPDTAASSRLGGTGSLPDGVVSAVRLPPLSSAGCTNRSVVGAGETYNEP
jgi:hypothetical protein